MMHMVLKRSLGHIDLKTMMVHALYLAETKNILMNQERVIRNESIAANRWI